MRFIRLVLEDYAGFNGRHCVEFPNVAPGRNVVLVGGMNGAGKTSLIEGVVLCLYGFDGWEWWFRKGGGRRSDYHRRVRQALNEAARDAGRRCVSLELELEDGSRVLRIRRRWWMSRSRDVDSEDLQMWEDGYPVEVGIHDPADRIRRIQERINFVVPPEVSPFFFFDAERVRSIAETNPAANIQEGLDRLLQLDALNTLVQHLDEIQRDLSKGTSTTGDDDPASLQLRLDELRATEARIAEDIERLTLEVEENEKVLERLRLRLAALLDLGGDQRSRVAEQQARLRAEEKELARTLGSVLAGSLALALSGRLFGRMRAGVIELRRARSVASGREALSSHVDGLTRWVLDHRAAEELPIPFTDDQRSYIQQRIAAYPTRASDVRVSTAARVLDGMSDMEIGDLQRRIDGIDFDGARRVRAICLEIEESRRHLRDMDNRLARLGAASKVSNPLHRPARGAQPPGPGARPTTGQALRGEAARPG